MEFATFDLRVASFAPPTKRSKAGWPHKTPTPTDLAKAGFFYKPTESKDNVECFHCGRQLDGWEKEDDPLQEHLQHGHDCAWALLMSLEIEKEFDVSNMEDPTSARITDARRSTFESLGWPHDGKKGWLCKTEKMVEAGWHFAPTSEYEDYVSCVYCKLSLDGWEPKDDPYDEHYRRSPSCPFFAFAGSSAPSKRPKGKKGRTSRTSKASSRLSTHSNDTILTQAESVADVGETIGSIRDSLSSTISTTTKTKRKAPAKARTTKSKKAKPTKQKLEESTLETERTFRSESLSERMAVVEPKEQEQEQEQSVHDLVTVTQEAPSDLTTTEQRNSNTSRRHSTRRASRVNRSRMPSETIMSPASQTNNPASEELGEPDNEATPQPEPELKGPPPLQDSPMQIKQTSPLKSQTNPPRPTLSPVMASKSLSRPAGQESTTNSSSPASDVENAPPSARPERTRPPLVAPGRPQPVWTAADVDVVFQGTPAIHLFQGQEIVTEEEKSMTVQDWIDQTAQRAADDLRLEGERIVSVFESEGQRAMQVLEALVCV